MPITNGYATLAEFLSRYVPSAPVNDARDVTIEATIQTVSRMIDNLAVRRFWLPAADETRYYTADSEVEIWLPDDWASVTSLATDQDADGIYELTWSATDYRLSPPNAALDSWPYNQITRKPRGLYYFPIGVVDGVRLIGKPGFPAIPDLVKEACYLQSYRLYLRKTAPFGVAGSAEMGQSVVIPQLDPDVQMMILPFLRRV